MGRPKTTPESFWKCVDKTGGPDACWPWKGSLNTKSGHGKSRINYKHVSSHRLAYFFTNGKMPDGELLIHTCGNSACCNVSHLKVGPTEEERFWSKVDKNGPIPTHQPQLGNCWIWTGGKREHGHGHFQCGGKKDSPHRFSYRLHIGPIPEGLGVLHKCDNGSCVRTDHLFVGDQGVNMRDAASKGRTTQGERNHNAVLTAQQVIDIRRIHGEGETAIKDIAAQFGITRGAVSQIVRKVAWKHLE